MKPLLQHASRLLGVCSAAVAPSARSFGSFASETSLVCLRCRYRVRSAASQRIDGAQRDPNGPERWLKRSLWSSKSHLNDRKPPNASDPIPMPPPPAQPKPAERIEDRAPEFLSALEGQERLQEDSDVLLGGRKEEKKPPYRLETGPGRLSAIEAQERAQERLQEGTMKSKDADLVADNIARVPDEHLPSHKDRQRWGLSKRFSVFMDDLLPKLAVVTQKVNTYTGTDYSGVEALRREIQDQENLVKARRLAIDSAKQTLDIALAHQASSQKEVVALLERKHSWSASDLERYMALIRSEHVNDQAVREGKEAVTNAENALEEARSQLEKRERAQYHEEQIWSDTIRRNSTWVTFGLMGVNIFLLLLSLLVFEPWRRRRMVREIKTALEAHKVAIESAPIQMNAVTPTTAKQDIATIEEEIDRVIESEIEPGQSSKLALADSVVETPQPTGTAETQHVGSGLVPDIAPALPIIESKMTPLEGIKIEEIASENEGVHETPFSWHSVAAVARDIVSERVISIRRIDYTTAVLQGAAAGAIITAAVIAMLRPQ